MAKIHDLIGKVADPALKAALADEVRLFQERR